MSGRWSRVRAGVAMGALFLLALAALLVATLGSGTAPRAAGAPPPGCGAGSPRLTVTGSGLATGTPDLLTLTLSVDVVDGTAQAALADDNGRTAAVIGALRTGGVPASGIQTTGLSILPDYTFEHGTNVLTGYSVDNSVVARLTDFTTAGSVIDAAAGAGGNAVQITSLTFSMADQRPLQDRARTDAVHQAVAHAAAMAAGAGERLGQVCSLTDQSQVPSGLNSVGGTYAASPDQAQASVPLQAGTQQATAQVTLVYSLSPAPPPPRRTRSR